jgi:hypothetical protein
VEQDAISSAKEEVERFDEFPLRDLLIDILRSTGFTDVILIIRGTERKSKKKGGNGQTAKRHSGFHRKQANASY